ncbi:MAG: fliF [Verrucomicrobiales bacterium]|nr:fliF [Verrucomicrobiales bacterium]
MNNLTKLGTQLLGIWKELGLSQKINICLAAGVVAVGFVALMMFNNRPDYSLLYGKLDEGEAAKVIGALEESKIPYKIGHGGGSILVPADKVAQVRMQLAGKGIPKGEGVGFEIFDKPNFGISDFVQKANYVRAMQGELARTISQLNDVEGSRVMIVIPENRLLSEAQRKPTASVFVKVRGNGQLQPSAVNSIRFLVANAVEGLQANNVSVVDNLGNVLSENQESDSIAGMSNNQLGARKNLEQYLSKKAEGMLEKVLGHGQAVVRVAAEINWDTINRTEEKYDPDGQVVRTSVINDENSDTATVTGAAGGGAGLSSNSTDTNSVASNPVNSTRTRKKVTNNQYDVNKSTSNVVQGAGGIKHLSAAVFVSYRATGSGTNITTTPRTPEELAKLKKIVQSALGIMDTDTLRKDEITLEEIAFNDQPAIEMTQQLEKQEKTTKMWETVQKVGYPLLALGFMFMFWRSFKSAKSDEIPIGIPLGRLHGSNGSNGNGYRHEEEVPGVVSVDVLNRLIRENPDNMTQAVRSWLTQGRPK